MTYKLMVWAIHFLDTTFFIGLAGCAAAVIISWVSIFKDGFSRDDPGESK